MGALSPWAGQGGAPGAARFSLREGKGREGAAAEVHSGAEGCVGGPRGFLGSAAPLGR